MVPYYSFIRMSILTERGSLGLKFIAQSTLKPNDFEAERNTIRCFKWSDDGKQLVYCNNQESIVVRFPDWEVVTRVSFSAVIKINGSSLFLAASSKSSILQMEPKW